MFGRVAIYGAAGHTGRLLTARLLQSGREVIAVARSVDAFPDIWRRAGVSVRQAAIEDAAGLDRAFADADLVVNAAGPFGATIAPIVESALRLGRPVVDLCADPYLTRDTLRRWRDASAFIVPSLGFYGGLVELAVASMAAQMPPRFAVEVSFAIDPWLPTAGSRRAAGLLPPTRLALRDGKIVEVPASGELIQRVFGGSFGTQPAVIDYASPEPVLLSHDPRVQNCSVALTASTLKYFFDPTRPIRRDEDLGRRACDKFRIDIKLNAATSESTLAIDGEDIYDTSACLIIACLDAGILNEAAKGGALPPSRVFAPSVALDGLVRLGVDISRSL